MFHSVIFSQNDEAQAPTEGTADEKADNPIKMSMDPTYEQVIPDPDDPLEQDLLEVEPKLERRLKELQEKVQAGQPLTMDEDWDLNEIMADKIIITRGLRFREARQQPQRAFECKTDSLLTPKTVNVPLKHKLSDGQIKLILRAYSIDPETASEHPFGNVVSSGANIDKYYQRFNIDEEKYPKNRV